MTMTTITSRTFNQDISKAKRNAAHGPVIITDRGRPAHVLLTIEQYQKITGKEKSILDLLAMPHLAEVDLDPPIIDDTFFIPADLS